MFKRPSVILTLIAAALLLSACGQSGSSGGLRANLDPTNLGFEVDNSGEITVIANNIDFVNPAGAPEALVTGYRVEYYADDGEPLITHQESDLHSRHQAVIVPAGFHCGDGESQSCDLGERVAARMQSEPKSFILLPATVALHILENDLTRVAATVTFEATQGGRAVEWQQPVTVTYPVGD